MKKIILLALLACITAGANAQPDGTDAWLGLRVNVATQVSEQLAQYEALDNTTVLDTMGNEYSLRWVAQTAAADAATAYLERLELLHPEYTEKLTGQPSNLSVLFWTAIGICLGIGCTLSYLSL